MKNKEKYPHFRKYNFVEGGKRKKGKHPKLILERSGKDYAFMGLTESPKRGHHNNIPLLKNPEKGNKEPAYIREELRYAPTDHFGEILSSYNLSKEDRQRVLAYAERLKAKKKR